ncbi:PolC-type DNA polymerase III [Metamycoplasma equirhinis]|uniref:PolC-type DNA polymerase III n=2 Tax=Metamycoplasma equirhinis TaxID=92402 RepID=UPI0035948F66
MRKVDETFVKLCKEINFAPSAEFDGTRIINVEINRKGIWNFHISFDKHISLKNYRDFKAALNAKFPKSNISISIENILRDKKIVSDYLNYVIQTKFSQINDLRMFINEEDIELTENEIYFSLPSKTIYDEFTNSHETLKNALETIGFGFYTIHFKYHDKRPKKMDETRIKKLADKFNELKSVEKENSKKLPNTNWTNSYRKEKVKPIDMSIEMLHDTYEEILVTTKGEIYFLEAKTLKNNKVLYTLKISDYSEAIQVKKFYNEDDVLPDLKIGDAIYVTGRLTEDAFTKAKCIMAIGRDWFTITEGYLKLNEDKEETKRIELALRTNMSAQDGISKPIDYLNAAKFYGHEAIAITDLDDVQGFSSFYVDSKQFKNIKPIYGATISTINSANEFFYGFKDFELKNERYVVFDLETTGLSPRFAEIIEFGATIIESGKITENIQFFIKASKPLSHFTKELTNITDEMLSNGEAQEAGIKRIYEILKNSVCVAHNANFDINFCKEKFINLGLDTTKIVGIDTLAISHFLDPLERRHSLGYLSKRFNVPYDSVVAHRGDYDAEVLCKVWLKIISRLEREHNVKTSTELAKLWSKEMLARKHSYETRVIAKNQKGIKKLFKLVSTVLTDQYAEGAQLYFEQIKKDPDLFFGSSTHESYLWEQVFNGSSENILKTIQMFDYIELPPISTFEYLVKNEEITWDNLVFAYKDLIQKATSLGKLCVAVSDARYVYDFQKLIHDVYINAPTLGGGIHWLKKKSLHPKFKYLNTTEMKAEFKFLNDVDLIKQIVVDNPKKISDQIEANIQIIKDNLHVPEFDNSPQKLREIVYENLEKIYGKNPEKTIVERIEKELNPIIKYGYSVIYWISHKLIKKSNEDGYIVGSRGSVGSSIVAYLANISEVNPLDPHYLCHNCKYFEWNEDKSIFSGWDLPSKNCPKCKTLLNTDGHSIPFETFLGFEANKVPDIDLNFSGEYQPIIHNYVKELFGESHTFRAGTISTVASKTAYGFCKKYDEEKRVGEKPWSNQYLDFLATKTMDVKRTTGQHAGGVIIIPKEFDVEDFTPINYPANDTSGSWKTTHLDYRAIHDSVLKLDLLGHDDPTVFKMIEEYTNTDIHDIPKFDENVMKLFYTTESMNITPEDLNGETTGAFGLPEFGTNFVRGMLKTSQPRTFNDLILLSGLSHGTNVWAGNAEELVKQGLKLKDCVCCRDDIMLDLIKHNVDSLKAFEIMEKVRKGKGLTEEQEKLLIDHNIPEWYINSLKKIKYMFPKAHATAYVISAWRIAWYKMYYPLEFYAAYFSTKREYIDIKIMSSGHSIVNSRLRELKTRLESKDSKLTDKEISTIPILEIANEMYARGYKIKSVDLKLSNSSKWIIAKNEKAIIPPFNVVEGLGDTVAETIIEARNENEFISIEDLKERTKVNTKIESELRELGVLNNLDETNQTNLF